MRAIRPREIVIGESARATRTFGDILTGQFDVHACERRAFHAVNLESLLDLRENVAEFPRFYALSRPCAARRYDRLGVAVHRIRDPNDGERCVAHRTNKRRKRACNAVRATTGDEHHAAGLSLGRERADCLEQLFRRCVGPNFDADGIANSPTKLDVSRGWIARAKPDPRQVRRQIKPAFAARDASRERCLVGKNEQFVARKEVDALHRGDRAASERFHESQAFTDGIDHALIFRRERRMLHKREVPILRVMEIGEAAIDERSNEVERQRAAFVAAE